MTQETKYYSFIERFLTNYLSKPVLDKLSPEQKIDQFRNMFEPDIKIEAISDMAKIEVEAKKQEIIDN